MFLYEKMNIAIESKIGLVNFSYLAFYVLLFVESWLFWVFLYQECKIVAENSENFFRHFFIKPIIVGSILPLILTILKFFVYL